MAVPGGGSNGRVEGNGGSGGGGDVEEFDGDYDGEEWAVEREVPPHLRTLADAAHRGDLEALRSALDDYTGSIDDPVEDGDTVLHLSCLYGHLPCVQMLVERGASLEIKDEEGAIPLHDACAGGYTEIVHYILNVASDDAERVTRMLKSVDAEGDTPLHHAARGEHLEVVKLLLEAGAAPGKQNAYGQFPADLADSGTDVHSLLVEEASKVEGQQ